jgi:hypothetical protein
MIVHIPFASCPYTSFSKPVLPSTTLSKLQSSNVLGPTSAGGRVPSALVCSMQHVLVPWNVLFCCLHVCWKESRVEASSSHSVLFSQLRCAAGRPRVHGPFFSVVRVRWTENLFVTCRTRTTEPSNNVRNPAEICRISDVIDISPRLILRVQPVSTKPSKKIPL